MMQYQNLASALHEPVRLIGEKAISSAPSMISKFGDTAYQLASKAIHTYGQKTVDVLHSYTSLIKPAFAEMSVNNFCDRGISKFAKSLEYQTLINKIDTAVSVGNDMVRDQYGIPLLQETGKKAACMDQLYGIGTADGIQKFAPQTMSYFMENHDRLMEVAPDLVNNVTVPEFGIEAMGAMAAVLGSAIIVQRYSPKVVSGVKYLSNGTKSLFRTIGRKIT